jgi:DNA modification methylase
MNMIGFYSAHRDLVVDPFLGSGTSLIAAQKLGRIHRGIEINPRFVDLAIKRWEDYTEQKARLIRDGNDITDEIDTKTP